MCGCRGVDNAVGQGKAACSSEFRRLDSQALIQVDHAALVHCGDDLQRLFPAPLPQYIPVDLEQRDGGYDQAIDVPNRIGEERRVRAVDKELDPAR